MKLRIEALSEKHLKPAHKIYNYYITNSYSNFEEKKLSFRDFCKNYKKIIDRKLPYLVAISEEGVVGIAYLNKFREKSGYRFTFENTVYVHEEYLNKGIGTKLLKKLINISKRNKNIKKIIAVIGAIDSAGSVKIHKKNGFKKVAIFKKIGFKNGKWIDAIFMQKNI